MRFLTIRAKVTLYYTAFMILLVMIMFGILIKYSSNTILTNQADKLSEVLEETIEDVKEGDEIDFFEDGVYLLQYTAKQEYLQGKIPVDFPVDLELRDGQLQEVEEGEHIFYSYDRKVMNNVGQTIWIRGIISNTREGQLNYIIRGIIFILLPVLVILSSIMGYFVTKKAFKPVAKIQETAQAITKSGELSMRIGLPKGKDEISRLGHVIDDMLEQLEQSFEKEKQFTSDASHELRTPIAVILNESEYVLQHVNDIEEAKESMEVINRQANKMTKLINQLLFLARTDEGSISLQLEQVDINAVITEMINDRKMLSKAHAVTITFDTQIEPHKTYLVDRMLFFRAVQNVIQNAIVYGKPDGYVQIKIFEVPRYFCVEIKDNGIGMAKEDIDKIWNRFYQVDQARSRQESGSMGLGLSMVKWIIEKHGGYVQVESELNKGSKFSLYLPIKE
ncbi:MAG: HAMP domain-containing histidine kinase [Cellulosilyticum sp.]|nr:HAMP domain-containing histidine kinase [Cellulosilyticum sp.]